MAGEPERRRVPVGWVSLFAAWCLLVALLAAAFAVLQVLGPPAPQPLVHQAPLASATAPAPVPAPAAAAEAEPKTREGEAPPWQRFAAAVPAGQGPQLALVVTGLGLSAEVTAAAIERLPATVSLSFSPYGKDLAEWMARARAAGHEVLLDLPMEPESYPREDPGPQGLMAALPPEENLRRLAWIEAQGREYVGLTAVLGSRFARRREALAPLFEALSDRGLLFIANSEGAERLAAELARAAELPFATSDRQLDSASGGLEVVEARLAEVERLAWERGSALALIRGLPAIVERLASWCREAAERKLHMVPASALVVVP